MREEVIDVVHKRIMQVAILFGVLSIPTFASADSEIFETPVNTTSPVESISEEVTGTTNQLLNETEQPVNKTVDTVKVISEKVEETLEVEEPVVEVNLKKEPSIKVNTGVIDVDVSKNPSVKVDTAVAKVEVAEPLDVEVDTEVVQIEASIVPPPLATNEKPLVEDGEEQGTISQPQSMNKDEFPTVKDQIILEPPIDDKPSDTVYNSSSPLKENEFNPLQALPTIQTGPYHQINSSSGHFNMSMAILESLNQENANGFFTYFGQGRMFFDQWLNAPPSQPPRKSLLL